MITYFLAAGVGDVLPVLFVLIAIASGIINYFREKSAAQQAQPGRPVRPRDDGGDSEIEMFLEEVSGPDGRERPQRKRPRRRPQQGRRPPREKKPEAEPARQSVADRHMDLGERSNIGQRHVDSHVGERHLESNVEHRHLRSNVEGEAAALATRSRRTVKRTPIMRMLEGAGGVRTAVVLSEILSPPKGRRNRS